MRHRAGPAPDEEENRAALATTTAGLTSDEAARRRGLFGENRLPRPKRPGVLRLYLRQFANPLV